MRKLSQTKEAVGLDLKHLNRVLDRAKDNTTRAKKRNIEIVSLLSRAVWLYQEEVLGEAKDIVRRSA